MAIFARWMSCLLLVLLATPPSFAVGEFDGEWRGEFLGGGGCPDRPMTVQVSNYVLTAALGRGGLPISSTIRADNSVNVFWEGDKFLTGSFSEERFVGEASLGGPLCDFVLTRAPVTDAADASRFDGAWRLVEIDGCLAGYRVEAAIYVSGNEVTGIATGWLTEEFAGKVAEDGNFEAAATRYRIIGRIPETADEADFRYENISGDCDGSARFRRGQPDYLSAHISAQCQSGNAS